MRHGELAETNVLAGHTDFVVSEAGLQHMRSSAYGLAVNRCITSPLKRCQRFAKEFAMNQNLQLVNEPAIKEMDFGQWDGKPFSELWQMPSPNIGDFWQAPNQITPPNGESLAEFGQRIEQWWHDQLQNFTATSEDENVLVVTHAGVIKHIFGLLFGFNNDANFYNKLNINYGSIVTVKVCSDAHHPPWASLVI